MTAVAAIVIFAIAFVLIATEKVHRVAVAPSAAGAMALLGWFPARTCSSPSDKEAP
jgi:hypothetical protein